MKSGSPQTVEEAVSALAETLRLLFSELAAVRARLEALETKESGR